MSSSFVFCCWVSVWPRKWNQENEYWYSSNLYHICTIPHYIPWWLHFSVGLVWVQFRILRANSFWGVWSEITKTQNHKKCTRRCRFSNHLWDILSSMSNNFQEILSRFQEGGLEMYSQIPKSHTECKIIFQSSRTGKIFLENIPSPLFWGKGTEEGVFADFQMGYTVELKTWNMSKYREKVKCFRKIWNVKKN